MTRRRPSGFSLAVAAVSALLTAVTAQSVWESYYPPRERQELRRRKDYYEKVLRQADLSWEEGRHYRVMKEGTDRP